MQKGDSLMRAKLSSKLKLSLVQRPASLGLKLGDSVLQGATLGGAHDAASTRLATLPVAADVATPMTAPAADVATPLTAATAESIQLTAAAADPIPLAAPAADAGSAMLATTPEATVSILAAAPAVSGILPTAPTEPLLHPAADVADTARGAVQKVVGDRRAQLLDSRVWVRVRLVADASMLYLASSAAILVANSTVARSNRWLAAAFPLVALALICAGRNPEERLHASALDTAAHILGVISLAAMLTIAAGAIIGTEHHVAFALRLWVFAAAFVGIERMVLFSYRRYTLSNPALATPTLIVGAGAVGARLAMRLLADPGYGLRPAGFLDTDPMPRPDQLRTPLVPVLGGPNDLDEAIARTNARHVILAFTTEPDHVLIEKVKECQALGIEVSLVPRMYEAINERASLDHVGGLPLLSLRRTDPHGWKFWVKHALDRVLAAVLLAVLAPLMLAIAIAIRASSPGPLLFRQRRVGRDGREFDLLKFRTMFEVHGVGRFVPPDGCAPGGVEGVDRRTPIGRWLRGAALDELPQFLNVLRGEMSLVGPRPERPEYVARFDTEIDHYRDRRRVKSGITGWAQVNGLRGQTSIADRVEWDNYYIENWSLRLDLRIMLLTIAEIVRLRDTAIADAQD
jgi:exopolysaccharide biosynthesis polyprenyl glycosylphosphotransferase